MRHIYTNELPALPRQVTRRWELRSRVGGHFLGLIKWYAPWRRYCFEPAHSPTVFEQDCLYDIAEFLAIQTRDHKKMARLRKEELSA